jgi:hypothetical protein
MYDGTVFQLLQPNLNLGVVTAQNGFVAPVNLSLSCTAAANALTCSMLSGLTGGNPSALSPVYVPFRNATIANGGVVWRTVTSGVSFTVSGGNTMGCVSGAPCRLWISAVDNGGTVLLGLSNQTSVGASSAQVFSLNEGALQTTGAGTGGGSVAGTIFTSVATVSNAPIRIIGYVEWTTLTTAGNWTTPNFVQLFGPGIKKPGDTVQTVYASTTTLTLIAGATPTVTTATLSITPTSAANLVRTFAIGVVQSPASASTLIAAQVYRNAGGSAACTTAVGALSTQYGISNGTGTPTLVGGIDAPRTTSQQTYAVCANSQGGSGNGVYCPSSVSSVCTLEATEIMGENDNERVGLPVTPKAA